MDIKNLTTFLNAAELGGFTRAAEKLGYSQSTVSFHIRQLEDELHTQLFERVGHTVSLTEKGREVLKYAHEISRLTEELQDSMRGEGTLRGCVRIAMADSLCDVFAERAFLPFRAQYPGISLQLLAAGTSELLRLVNQNEVDLIMTLDSHIYNTEYVILHEEKVGVHFVAGSGHPLAHAAAVPLADLVHQPFLLTEKGMSYRRLLEEKLAELSLEIQPVLEIGSTELICSLVEQGAGISFLPDYVIKDRVKAGTLVCLPVSGLEIQVWKQLLYHRNKWVSPQMETVLKYCVSREFIP